MKRSLVVLIAIVLALVVLRAALPSLVTNYINDQIAALDGYDGQIESVDLLLLAGRYRIHHTEIIRTGGGVPVPLLKAESISLQLSWRALFSGRIEGSIHFDKAELNIVDGPTQESRQTGTEGAWNDLVESLFPFVINRIEISDSRLHFRNFQSDPPVNLMLEDIQLTISNLRNRAVDQDQRAARFYGTALLEEQAALQLDGSYEWLASQPDFDFRMRLEQLPIDTLDDLLRAYLNIDASGSLTVTAEIKVRDGHLEGYVQPLIRDLDILEWEKDVAQGDKGPLSILWQGLLDFITEIFENQPQSQFGSRIPVTGDLDNIQTESFTAFFSVLYNAFIEALQPGYPRKQPAEAEKEPQ